MLRSWLSNRYQMSSRTHTHTHTFSFQCGRGLSTCWIAGGWSRYRTRPSPEFSENSPRLAVLCTCNERTYRSRAKKHELTSEPHQNPDPNHRSKPKAKAKANPNSNPNPNADFWLMGISRTFSSKVSCTYIYQPTRNTRCTPQHHSIPTKPPRHSITLHHITPYRLDHAQYQLGPALTSMPNNTESTLVYPRVPYQVLQELSPDSGYQAYGGIILEAKAWFG